MNPGTEPLLSVLLADVPGSMRLHERLGGEEARRAIERCLNRAGRCVSAFGGRIVITQSHELTTLAEILPLAKGLLKDIEYTTHPIRLIGLSVSNPYEKNEEKARWEQLSFEFSDWDYSK